jgi:hypothetical protein
VAASQAGSRGRVESDNAERVAEDVPQQDTLRRCLSVGVGRCFTGYLLGGNKRRCSSPPSKRYCDIVSSSGGTVIGEDALDVPFPVRRGSLHVCVPHGIGGTSSGFEFFLRCQAIGKSLRSVNGPATPLIGQQVPNPAAARHGEQSTFPVAGLAQEERQQRSRVSAANPLSFRHELRLFEQHIHDPASAHLWPCSSAVFKDVDIPAPRIFQRISQDRQAVADAVVVNGLGQRDDRSSVSGQPRRVGNRGCERVAENTAQQTTVLGNSLAQVVPSGSPLLLQCARPGLPEQGWRPHRQQPARDQHSLRAIQPPSWASVLPQPERRAAVTPSAGWARPFPADFKIRSPLAYCRCGRSAGKAFAGRRPCCGAINDTQTLYRRLLQLPIIGCWHLAGQPRHGHRPQSSPECTRAAGRPD